MSLWKETFRQALPGRGSTVDRSSLNDFALLSARNASLFHSDAREYTKQLTEAFQTPSFTKGTSDARRGWLESATVAIAECDAHTFISVAPEWLTAAYTALKSNAFEVAAWHLVTSIARRLERLRDLGGLSRSCAPAVARLAQLVASAVQAAAAQSANGYAAFSAMLRALTALQPALPSALRQQTTALSTALVPLLLKQRLPEPVFSLAAVAWMQVSLSQGTPEGWQATLQTLLVSVHNMCDVVFLGAEKAPHTANAVKASRSLLDPTAAPLPDLPGQGGRQAAAVLSLPVVQDACVLTMRLMSAAAQQLNAPFPVPVALPLTAIVALAQRVLSVDDATVSAARTPSLSRGATLCRALPGLHVAALQLLTSALDAAGPAGICVVGRAARVLARYSSAPSSALVPRTARVRHALHAALQRVAAVGGVGVARALGRGGLDAVAADSYGVAASSTNSSAVARTMLLEGDSALSRSDLGSMLAERQVDVCVEALDTLRTLLRCCSAAMIPADRDKIDAMCAHLASLLVMDAPRTGSESITQQFEAPQHLQVAAVMALQASILAARPFRAPYLAAALNIFQRGVASGATGVATACQASLLACDALLHPHATPLQNPEIKQLQAQQQAADNISIKIGDETSGNGGTMVLQQPIFWHPNIIEVAGPSVFGGAPAASAKTELFGRQVGPPIAEQHRDHFFKCGPTNTEPDNHKEMVVLDRASIAPGKATLSTADLDQPRQQGETTAAPSSEPLSLPAFEARVEMKKEAPQRDDDPMSDDEGGLHLEPIPAPHQQAGITQPPAKRPPKQELPLEFDSEDEPLPDIDSGASSGEE